ncbi:class I SAM-dependent methyltransferase [Magnetococcus sp. PR-3]|uniref:class I SAM-dependent methyltransferase n=1 Tax=Magnetococcus sp. PR-3 TaxID=3120355 RepID=UPI002FCE5CDD
MQEEWTREMDGEALWQALRDKYESEPLPIRYLNQRFFKRVDHLLADVDAEDSVLELGAGPGVSSMHLYQTLGKNRTFAISEGDARLVECLKAMKLPFPVSQEDITKLDRADNSWDGLICLEVLEHLPSQALVEQALQEIFRVAQKWVILSVPNEPLWRVLNMMRGAYWSDWGNTPGHINHWSPSAFAQLVGQYGTVVNMEKPLPWTILKIQVP